MEMELTWNGFYMESKFGIVTSKEFFFFFLREWSLCTSSKIQSLRRSTYFSFSVAIGLRLTDESVWSAVPCGATEDKRRFLKPYCGSALLPPNVEDPTIKVVP